MAADRPAPLHHDHRRHPRRRRDRHVPRVSRPAASAREFDAWRGAYRNPSKKHLGSKKTKNWDSAERRADLERDGVVAEVIFPNTVPPFYDKAFHVSPPPTPEQYQRWLAGTRAHNRWLADFCAEEPAAPRGHRPDPPERRRRRDRRRAVDRRARPARRRAAAAAVALDDVHLEPLNSPELRPALGGDPGPRPRDQPALGAGLARATATAQGIEALWVLEMPFFVQRGFTPADHGRRLRALPAAALHPDRVGLRVGAGPDAPAWTAMYLGMKAGAIGEIDTSRDRGAEGDAELLRAAQLLVRRELPVARATSRAATSSASTRSSGATTTRTTRAAIPYSRENMRLAFADVDETEVRMMLGENAAKLYGFDLDALRPAAETRRHHARARARAARRDPGRLDVPDVPARALRAGARGGSLRRTGVTSP